MDNMNVNGMPGMNRAPGMGGTAGIPPVQPIGGPRPMSGPQPVQPIQPAAPAQPMGAPGMPAASGMPGQPMVQKNPAAMKPKDITGLIKTIVIIVVSLIAVTFIGLFIWMSMNYQEAQTDLDTKVAVAVAEAKDEQAMELEQDFLEREKYPYKTFSGPIDYGQLTFEYPKTWSVYVAAAAANSDGDFNAYFNPIQVDAVSKETVNALRVTIRDKSIDEVSKEYQKAMDKKDSNLTMVSTTIGKDGNITANRYTGTIPDTKDLSGIIVTFKIRDKTAILQTDSVLFQEDFDKLLGTVTFNE